MSEDKKELQNDAESYKDPVQEKGARFKKTIVAVICLLHAAIIGLFVSIICLNNNRNAYLSVSEQTQYALLERIDSQQSEIDRHKQTIQRQQDALASMQSITGSVDADDLLRQIEQQQTLLAQQEEELAAMKELLDNIGRATNGYTVYFKKYVVVKGDTLRTICRKNGLSYLSNKKVILGVNGITDENMIIIGQTLLLPAVIVPKG